VIFSLLAFPPISYMHSSSPPFVLHVQSSPSHPPWLGHALQTCAQNWKFLAYWHSTQVRSISGEPKSVQLRVVICDLRCGWGHPTQLGPLDITGLDQWRTRLTLSNGPQMNTWCLHTLSLRAETDAVSETSCYFKMSDDGQVQKLSNPNWRNSLLNCTSLQHCMN
jgi:hypothetical protein